jgi:two-component system, NtrC family, response regulator AtoC
MSRFSGTPEGLTIDETTNQPNLTAAAPSVPAANGNGNGNGNSNDEPIISLRSARVRVEVEAIRSALRRTGWNRKQAARLLKISYRGLLYKIRQYDITAA